VETIKSSEHTDISSELEISKALQFLKKKDFAQVMRFVNIVRLLKHSSHSKIRIKNLLAQLQPTYPFYISWMAILSRQNPTLKWDLNMTAIILKLTLIVETIIIIKVLW
jgi:hypothetical protein